MFLETFIVLIEKNAKDGSNRLLRKLVSACQTSGRQISVAFTLTNKY
jgi:hypothetical protein